MTTPSEARIEKAKREHYRMDFIHEVISKDEQSRIVTMILKPDPRRYNEVMQDGHTAYLDKYLNHLLPPDVLEQMAATMKGVPFYNVSPKINDTADYSDARLAALRSELNGGGYVPPQEKPYPNQPVAVDEVDPITFLSLDICGASAARCNNSSAFDRAYETLIQELTTVVGQFGASVFKTTGDGFIAFNDHPSFTRQCDNVIDLGLSLISVQHSAINTALTENGLPPLQIRVGAEHGYAKHKVFSNPVTGFKAADIVSDALNRAVKIQESCGCNEFRIGRRLYELIHVQWLERSEIIAHSIGEQVGDPGYRVYRVT